MGSAPKHYVPLPFRLWGHNKLLVKSTIVGTYLIILPFANRVESDQAALTDLGLLCLRKVLKCVSMGDNISPQSVLFA